VGCRKPWKREGTETTHQQIVEEKLTPGITKPLQRAVQEEKEEVPKTGRKHPLRDPFSFFGGAGLSSVGKGGRPRGGEKEDIRKKTSGKGEGGKILYIY